MSLFKIFLVVIVTISLVLVARTLKKQLSSDINVPQTLVNVVAPLEIFLEQVDDAVKTTLSWVQDAVGNDSLYQQRLNAVVKSLLKADGGFRQHASFLSSDNHGQWSYRLVKLSDLVDGKPSHGSSDDQKVHLLMHQLLKVMHYLRREIIQYTV